MIQCYECDLRGTRLLSASKRVPLKVSSVFVFHPPFFSAFFFLFFRSFVRLLVSLLNWLLKLYQRAQSTVNLVLFSYFFPYIFAISLPLQVLVHENEA